MTTGEGEYVARYVVFTSGRARELAEGLGCDLSADGTMTVNLDNESSVENAYAAGWCARADKIQAAISVAGGAAAGPGILSREEGRAVHDFDTPDDGA